MLRPLGLNYLLLPRKAHRTFAQQKALHAVTHVSWNEEGIVFETEHGHSRHSWADFVDMAENEALVLLFQSDNLFNFVPKRALSTDDAADLASRGAQHLRGNGRVPKRPLLAESRPAAFGDR